MGEVSMSLLSPAEEPIGKLEGISWGKDSLSAEEISLIRPAIRGEMAEAWASVFEDLWAEYLAEEAQIESRIKRLLEGDNA